MVSRTIQPTPWGPRDWPSDVPLRDLPSVGSVMSGPSRSMYAQIHSQSEDGTSVYLPGIQEGLKSGFEAQPPRPRRVRRQPTPLFGQGRLLRALFGGR